MPILTLVIAKRSFEALRLANFLFHPCLDIVQALLILGNTLQNMGQSDAAWVLLGTTIRLAQSLGLHTEAVAQRPGCVGVKARAVWYATTIHAPADILFSWTSIRLLTIRGVS